VKDSRVPMFLLGSRDRRLAIPGTYIYCQLQTKGYKVEFSPFSQIDRIEQL